MNMPEKFAVGVKTSFDAVFHKKNLFAQMGVVHDGMEPIANMYDYLKFDKTMLYKYCQTNQKDCQEGIREFREKDYKSAYKKFSQVSEDEYPEILFCRAYCLLFGKGVRKDEKEAIALLKKGAEIGSLCAKQLLARCYIEGRECCSIDKRKAVELIKEVLSKKDADVLSDLSDDIALEELSHFCGVYYFEQGDNESAAEYFKRAILSDFGLSYLFLGKQDYAEQGETELNRYLFDNARRKGVFVEHKYYKEMREDVTDKKTFLDGLEDLDTATGTVGNLLENIKRIQDGIVAADPRKVSDQIKADRASGEAEVARKERNAEQQKERTRKYKERLKKNEGKGK